MSISVLIVGSLRMACHTALKSDRPRIRCAAHSALISVQETPHTFSVYVLKKIWNSRRPNRFETHVSRSSSGFLGKSRAATKLQAQRTLSTGPSPKKASTGFKG